MPLILTGELERAFNRFLVANKTERDARTDDPASMTLEEFKIHEELDAMNRAVRELRAACAGATELSWISNGQMNNIRDRQSL